MKDPIEVVDLQSLKPGYSGKEERERMSRLRLGIEVVRNAWLRTEEYWKLIAAVRECSNPETLPPEVRLALERLPTGFRDYADVQSNRPVKAITEQYDALELYCSVEGFDHLFKPVVGNTVRSETASEKHLLAVATLVELLTIDLYNLRLSHIGNPRYENFEGITHRDMSVTLDTIKFYEDILRRPDLSLRGFAIPLALTSTSTEPIIGQSFEKPNLAGMVHMNLVIHTHGINRQLLEAYIERYPDSVVTSICAMPVGYISLEHEKEVLLRGAFFQLLAVNRTESSRRA